MTSTVVVAAEWWTFLLGVVLPAIVALVRDRASSSKWGALLLVAVTAVTAVVSEIVVAGDGSASFEWGDVGKRFVVLFITAVVAHYGLLRPLGVTGSDGAINRAVPQGLGGPATPPPV